MGETQGDSSDCPPTLFRTGTFWFGLELEIVPVRFCIDDACVLECSSQTINSMQVEK